MLRYIELGLDDLRLGSHRARYGGRDERGRPGTLP